MKIKILNIITATMVVICIIAYIKNNKTIANDSNITLFKDHDIFWIDNNKLLFAKGSSTCTNQSGSSYSTLIFLEYNVQEDSTKFYDKMNVLSCYNNGTIIYSQKNDCSDQNATYSASYYDKKDKHKVSGYVNPISCTMEKAEWDDTNLSERERTAMPRQLSENHGWILGSKPGIIYIGDDGRYSRLASSSLEPEYAIYPVMLYPSSDGDGIQIDKINFEPWIERGYHVQILRYEKFKNAYLLGLKPSPQNRETNIQHAYWWLYQDGRIESIISFNSSANNIFEFMDGDILPTKTGLFLVGGGDPYAPIPNFSASHGLYKMNSKGIFEQIFNGDIKHPSLSPDGCKLAFARMPKIFDPKKEEGIVGTYFLQTINLCELDE